MSFGFGIEDYFVVGLTVMVTWWLLASRPERLLLWLPTFLTLDFFLPGVSQLTPSRLIPLMLGGWLVFRGFPRLRNGEYLLLSALSAAVLLSMLFSFGVGDAGFRPLLRALHYLSLMFVFLFVLRTATHKHFVELALWGIFVASLIHGYYAVYQLFASAVGLPFRGIVYNATSDTSAVFAGGLLRVNGFADEPKRLGYILFSGALAAAYFARLSYKDRIHAAHQLLPKFFRSRRFLIMTAVVCVAVSLLTFSSSYFLAVAATGAVLAIGGRFRKLAPLLALSSLCVGLLALAAPQVLTQYTSAATSLLDARMMEFSDSSDLPVYRQEFYAEDYVEKHPLSLVTGVGIGRYNKVFADTFGPGAGYTPSGDVKPLNSQLLEVGLDLGLLGLAFLYLIPTWVAVRSARQGQMGYFVFAIAVFLVIQSILIDDKFYIAFIIGIAFSMLRRWRAQPVQTSDVNSRRLPVAVASDYQGRARMCAPTNSTTGSHRHPACGRRC